MALYRCCGGGGTEQAYGMIIDNQTSAPASKITYIDKAEGMTPAYMDYTNNVFNYGDWGDAFFLPRPCMLLPNGTVDYYLNANDYTKKADGTASDIANTSYTGNAMMEWPRIYWKVKPYGTNSAVIWIADKALDDDYHAWCNYDKDNVLRAHFYTPIYNGSLINSTLRSLSGQSIMYSKTAQQEVTYALANGDRWYTETYAQRILISMLLMLMGRSTNTQAVFGQGYTGGSESTVTGGKTGQLNDKGLFWGSSGTTSHLKVFGMENWWGFQWRRTAGLYYNSAQKYKLTRGNADGSTATDYNFDGTGYLTGNTMSGTSGSYISSMQYRSDGSMLTYQLSGSESTYYCDGAWYANSGYALFSGGAGHSSKCGAFCCNLNDSASAAGWYVGAALSYT